MQEKVTFPLRMAVVVAGTCRRAEGAEQATRLRRTRCSARKQGDMGLVGFMR